MAEKIKALLIFEILGRPSEYIKITLEQLIDRLGENKGVKVIERKVHEPHEADKRNEKGEIVGKVKGLYSTFAEVEVEVDGLNLLFAIVLHMMPSSIEILSPSELKLKNFDLSSVLTELAVKLHKYDEIAKAVIIERDNLIKEVEALRQGQTKISFSESGIDIRNKNKKIVEKNDSSRSKGRDNN